MAWLFADEATEATEQIAAMADDATVHVPIHWFVEVSNGAVKGERRRRVQSPETDRFLGWLVGLDLVVDSEGAETAFERLLPPARAMRLSVYDAAYLDLAQRLGLPLAATDGALRDAATAAGVALLPA